MNKIVYKDLSYQLIGAAYKVYNSLGFGFLFKSYLIGLSAWLIGWAMDCDHLFDYFLYLRKFKTKLNLQEFFDGVFF